ncbi:MAG: tRNA pseudouridine(55) synthase TruB [Fuerstiella sp.]|nr:tRNA pseudouridine(55) synthase TruB [Fuerstiella sp.]MCP4787886.1 tRNA pseudouridine(55) synthase TruB [Fuerstiella sp.]MCP4859544.1 tRNA pseudouridine(55) synthase TruB [Fuerstiella sp.]
MFGVLNLNKPAGVTSRDVVNVVQRLVKPAKVGHAGTLDPMATGVLLVCVGAATRLISLLQRSSKTYVAGFRFGQRSDTDDSSGTVTDVPLDGNAPSEQELRCALQNFIGRIEQVPPAFSAVKVNGQRAYAKARRGESVELKSKTVQVFAIDVTEYCWPNLTLQIQCGSGTYIRSIARDLGELLGCGGLMTSLKRTAIGEFPVAAAIDPDILSAESIVATMTDPILMVASMPKYQCGIDDEDRVRLGRQLSISESGLHIPDGIDTAQVSEIAVVSTDGTRLLALGELNLQNGVVQPRTVFIR